jgi:hypothetical protein
MFLIGPLQFPHGANTVYVTVKAILASSANTENVVNTLESIHRIVLPDAPAHISREAIAMAAASKRLNSCS